MAKKGKGFFGAVGSFLGSIPVVKSAKKAAKSVKKKIKKAKKKLEKALKKAKKKLKKKLGKVLTKARKLKNNLSKSKLVKKIKKAVKKAVKKAKKYVKKVVKTVKKAAKTAVKAVKKAAKTTVKAVKKAAKTTVKAVKKAAKTTVKAVKSGTKTAVKAVKTATKTAVKVAKSATKKAAVFVKSVSISQAISTAADFIPVVGNAKAVFETVFGFDPITREKLSAVDRGISAAGILGGGYAKAAGKGGKTALNLFSNSKNATNVAESAAKSSKNAASATKGDIPKGTGENISHPVLDNTRSGSALKKPDGQHGFNDIIDNYTPHAKEFEIVGGDGVKRKLYQIEGGMKYYDYKDVYNRDLRINERITTVKDQNGIFEWIVDPTKGVTHRRFIPNGQITGSSNQRP